MMENQISVEIRKLFHDDTSSLLALASIYIENSGLKIAIHDVQLINIGDMVIVAFPSRNKGVYRETVQPLDARTRILLSCGVLRKYIFEMDCYIKETFLGSGNDAGFED